MLQEVDRARRQLIRKNPLINDEVNRGQNYDLEVSASSSSASSWLVDSLLVDFAKSNHGSLLKYWCNLMISEDDVACSLQGCCFCLLQFLNYSMS